MDGLPDDECALLVVAFDGDDGDVGATAVDAVVAAPAGTDESVGVVATAAAGGGDEFSADPGPMDNNEFKLTVFFCCFAICFSFNFTCCCCCFG